MNAMFTLFLREVTGARVLHRGHGTLNRDVRCLGEILIARREQSWIVGRSRDHYISRAYGTTIALPTVIDMVDRNTSPGTSMGYSYLMGNYPPRRTLSPPVAVILEQAHRRNGASYRRVAAVLGISYPFWWRLCRGERAPSKRVAFRIIDVLGLDDDTADLLLDESGDKTR